MKRALAYVLAATLSLCAGCTPIAAPPMPTPVPTPTPTPSVEQMPTPTTVPSPTPEAQEPHQYYKNIGEETYSYQYEGYNVQIKYPYLCNETEDKEMNDLLRQEALGHYLTGDENDIRSNTPEGFLSYIDGDWEAVRNDERLLSIFYRQEYSSGGPVGWSGWGVTLDRANKKRLSLADIVDTGDDFEAWLYAQDWTVLAQWIGDGDEIGKDRDYLEQLLPLYMGWSADPAEHIRDFYISDTDIFLIVWEGKYDTHLSVPLSDLTLKGDDLWNG